MPNAIGEERETLVRKLAEAEGDFDRLSYEASENPNQGNKQRQSRLRSRIENLKKDINNFDAANRYGERVHAEEAAKKRAEERRAALAEAQLHLDRRLIACDRIQRAMEELCEAYEIAQTEARLAIEVGKPALLPHARGQFWRSMKLSDPDGLPNMAYSLIWQSAGEYVREFLCLDNRIIWEFGSKKIAGRTLREIVSGHHAQAMNFARANLDLTREDEPPEAA